MNKLSQVQRALSYATFKKRNGNGLTWRKAVSYLLTLTLFVGCIQGMEIKARAYSLAISGQYGEFKDDYGTVIPLSDLGFTYTGTAVAYKNGLDWYILFKTDGSLKYTTGSRNFEMFLVGGGGNGYHTATDYCGGGGGGGYTTTTTIAFEQNKTIYINVGTSQGSATQVRRTSSYGTILASAAAGKAGGNATSTTWSKGGDGGSGGGAENQSGGTNGSSGGNSYGNPGGTGQGSTTKAFGGDYWPYSDMLYSGGGTSGGGRGGAGGGGNRYSSAAPNSGGGGGGTSKHETDSGGASGVVILRRSEPCANPTSLTYSNPMQGQPTYVNWNAAPQGTGIITYFLRRNGVIVYQGTDLAYTDYHGLPQGASIQYSVSCQNSFSATYEQYMGLRYTVLAPGLAPSVPSNLTVPDTIIPGTGYLITWGSSSGTPTVIYYLQRQINGGSWVTIYSGVGNSFSDNLSMGQANTVTYRVYATNGFGTSGYRTSAVINPINNTPPTIPTISMQPIAEVNQWDSPNLTWTWNASTDAQGDAIYYAVELSKNGGAFVQVQNEITTNRSYTYNLTNEQTVQIRIRAYDKNGGINYSGYATSIISTIIQDTNPPTLTLTADPATGWTGDDVTITVMTANGISPLDKISAPEESNPAGNIGLSGKSATRTFKVSANGVYSFTVYNKAGLSTTKSITVNNIDKTQPTIIAELK